MSTIQEVCFVRQQIIFWFFLALTLFTVSAENSHELQITKDPSSQNNPAIYSTIVVWTKENVEEKLSELMEEHGDEIAALREFKQSLLNAYALIYQNEDEKALSLLEELRVEANNLNLENVEEINCLIGYLGKRKSTVTIKIIVVVTAVILLALWLFLKRIRRKTTAKKADTGEMKLSQ